MKDFKEITSGIVMLVEVKRKLLNERILLIAVIDELKVIIHKLNDWINLTNHNVNYVHFYDTITDITSVISSFQHKLQEIEFYISNEKLLIEKFKIKGV